METRFDVIVVGAGMMGSAAARHLSERGARVAVVGPPEPDDAQTHTGPFASHYDAARITRRLATDVTWSRLSARSIERYRDLEDATGIRFYHEQGVIMAISPRYANPTAVDVVRDLNATQGIGATEYDGATLKSQFPYLAFPDDTWIGHEAVMGGYLNPRAHIRAQLAAARAAGAVHLPFAAVSVTQHGGFARAMLADGQVLEAGTVVVACGAYSLLGDLIPQTAPQTPYARTIAFAELDAAEQDRLREMPSIIYYPPDTDRDLYVLPPVRYPDGRTYLKIGGDPFDVPLGSADEINAWFRQNGNANVATVLLEILHDLIPDLRAASTHFAGCVVTNTATGHPYICHQSENVVLLTGGNGAGAKNADEIGRLGAILALEGKLPRGEYPASFGLPVMSEVV
ncbi:MAG: FAD-binding oxidoreductase [Rhodobacteraceae bacterium]|nr:FAD-binding oxidoreductase [Paracoccaceae bacterium]